MVPLQHHAFPFETGFLEVQEDTDLKTRDSQVVQHLAQFMISDPLDGLYVDHDLAKADQVGDILSNFDVLVDHIERALLLVRNSL